MGQILKETPDNPIEGIDTLLEESAKRMGAHVTETMFSTFYGQNFSRVYASERSAAAVEISVSEDPKLIGV